jgi:ribosomal protein S18
VLPEEPLDYKNIAYLSKFVSANGRIQSRKRTGFSGQNQRHARRGDQARASRRPDAVRGEDVTWNSC